MQQDSLSELPAFIVKWGLIKKLHLEKGEQVR